MVTENETGIPTWGNDLSTAWPWRSELGRSDGHSAKQPGFAVEPHRLDPLIDSLAFGTTCSAKIRTWPSSSPSMEGQKMNVSNPKSWYDETSQSTQCETEPTNGLFSWRKNGFFSDVSDRC